MKKLNTIQSLTTPQWAALWRSYWGLWPMVLRIKFKQFFKDTSWITENVTMANEALTSARKNKRSQISYEKSNDLDVANQLHESVRLAARLHFLPANCLVRSLTLANLLEARDINASVFIGVSKRGDELASHAWLEVHGYMVAEPETIDRDFTRLKS